MSGARFAYAREILPVRRRQGQEEGRRERSFVRSFLRAHKEARARTIAVTVHIDCRANCAYDDATTTTVLLVRAVDQDRASVDSHTRRSWYARERCTGHIPPGIISSLTLERPTKGSSSQKVPSSPHSSPSPSPLSFFRPRAALYRLFSAFSTLLLLLAFSDGPH